MPNILKVYLQTILNTHLKLDKYDKESLIKEFSIFNINFKLQLILNEIAIHEYSTNNKKIHYEETILFLLNSILKNYDEKKVVFYDIGAFIGYYAAFVSARSKNKSKTLAIESNKKYTEAIIKTKKLNNFNNLDIYHEALSNKEEIIIYYNEQTIKKDDLIQDKNVNVDYGKTYQDKDIEKYGKSKKSITLDNFCKDNNSKPNIIKIDVHGAEGKILLGSSNTLSNSVEIILLEIHPQHYLNAYSNKISRFEIIDFINKHGFKTYLISPFRINLRMHEYKEYKKYNKIKYLEITNKNYNDVLFGITGDIFLLCLKDNIQIDKFDCF